MTRSLARRADALRADVIPEWKAAWRHFDGVPAVAAARLTDADVEEVYAAVGRLYPTPEGDAAAWAAELAGWEAPDEYAAELDKAMRWEDAVGAVFPHPYSYAEDAGLAGLAGVPPPDLALWPDALPSPPGDPAPFIVAAAAHTLNPGTSPGAAADGAAFLWGLTCALAHRAPAAAEIDALHERLAAGSSGATLHAPRP